MSILHVAFYPSDWLAGTRGMSASETGVYITLVARMYEMAGPIERDDNRLARLCGCKGSAAFVRDLEYLISEGKIIETENGLINERAEKEIQNATEKSSKAKAAAQSRWDKKANKNKGSGNANASAKHMRNGCQLEPELDITEAKASDSAAVLWKEGIPFLCERGVRESQARSIIGKWLKASIPDDILSALSEARTSQTQDPIPYITEILKPKSDAAAEYSAQLERISGGAA